MIFKHRDHKIRKASIKEDNQAGIYFMTLGMDIASSASAHIFLLRHYGSYFVHIVSDGGGRSPNQ